MTHTARWWMAAGLAALLGAAGCGRQLNQVLLPESRPDIRLTQVRLDPPTPDSCAYMARWVGLSTGRSISHYVYAIDPRSVDAVDATWVRTTATQRVLTFPRPDQATLKRDAHVFVVRAVDDRGEMSEPKYFAVVGDNLPPVVQITRPVPTRFFTPRIPPTFRFEWTGTDPDGQTTTAPVRYVFRLFGQKNPDRPDITDFISYALTYPDSLRAFYAPGFQGWNSVDGGVTSFEYQDLTLGSNYLFAVTGFDEVGDYDPIFLSGKNLQKVAVTNPGSTGPLLTMFNQFFDYTYPSGGWINDPSRWVRVEVPAGQPVTVNWRAIPLAGSQIECYRWVLDPPDLADPRERRNENQTFRWSRCDLGMTSATVGPFSAAPGQERSHLLYIEARGSYGFVSLGIVNLVVVEAKVQKDLLFVDDTRLRVDQRTSATNPAIRPPIGTWPTAAELDTFLFARGGFPWRSYPAGTLSPPGICNGYDFDTVGTRGLPDGQVPLSLLAQYRHVVWYTDEWSAVSDAALRLMSNPGSASSLAAYVQHGGKVWLCGGGAALATLIGWNKPGTPPNEYNNLEPNPELRPGRFMYDFAHWRQSVYMSMAEGAFKFGTTSFGVGTNRPGRHWPPNPPLPTPPSPPIYGLLPAVLSPKTLATHPPPPLRSPDANWIRTNYMAEYIDAPTFIREDYDDDPEVVSEYSTLDTLYLTVGGVAGPNQPVMTYYHGRENQPMVFSGFNIWYWQRSQCVALVDWVLQSVWGLTRDASAAREPAVGARAPIAARPAAKRAPRDRTVDPLRRFP